jgi:hypothetical protein
MKLGSCFEFDPAKWSAARISSVSQSRNPAATPLTGAYFGATGDELGMEVTVGVTQPKQVESADLAGI